MTDKNIRPVSIGEIVVSANPKDVLVVYGLGSCVAVCLYDPVTRAGGMLHALLPTSARKNEVGVNPAKFVDQGIPLLIDSLVDLGAKPSQLTAKLSGGAKIITSPEFNESFYIGRRNVQMVELTLQIAGIKITTRAIGGSVGRTIKFYIADGQVTRRTLKDKKEKLL